MYTAYRQFVIWCRGYLGKKQSLSLLVLQLSLGKNLILLTFWDSNRSVNQFMGLIWVNF